MTRPKPKPAPKPKRPSWETRHVANIPLDTAQPVPPGYGAIALPEGAGAEEGRRTRVSHLSASEATDRMLAIVLRLAERAKSESVRLQAAVRFQALLEERDRQRQEAATDVPRELVRFLERVGAPPAE